ncbi:uncharacterized protein LOC131057782 isoform X1 [Cryptomeria japonica]|uniref:uncharacterized protein LOC131057782 isoform X1 n=1 Tax=Cryptomeria japonica TaxID=3369 RepID=UPI0025AC4103|nr:uncharacterized protein LOC131057782 isoform X1 [Cryptomeria japonica]
MRPALHAFAPWRPNSLSSTTAPANRSNPSDIYIDKGQQKTIPNCCRHFQRLPEFVSNVHLEGETSIESLPLDILIKESEAFCLFKIKESEALYLFSLCKYFENTFIH